MTYVVSVDPGAVHVGYAEWVEVDGLWECREAREITPTEYLDEVHDFCNAYDRPELVLVEGFWLRPGRDALRQAGSSMETVELIGATRYATMYAGIRFEKVQNGQDPIIKRLNAAGYEWTSMGHGGHAKDAEAVGVRGLGLSVKDLRKVSM